MASPKLGLSYHQQEVNRCKLMKSDLILVKMITQNEIWYDVRTFDECDAFERDHVSYDKKKIKFKREKRGLPIAKHIDLGFYIRPAIHGDTTMRCRVTIGNKDGDNKGARTSRLLDLVANTKSALLFDPYLCVANGAQVPFVNGPALPNRLACWWKYDK